MLEKPALPVERLAALLWEAYGLLDARLEFLPLGADVNTAVYRVACSGSDRYFLKLRKGVFDEVSVLLPRLLHDRGIRAVIEPLKTLDGQLLTHLDAFTCVLYPFVEGQSGFEAALSDEQWLAFGAALRAVHATVLPAGLSAKVATETYSPFWRQQVRQFQGLARQGGFSDALAAQMAAFMRSHQDGIDRLVERAEQFSAVLQNQAPERVLCHSDIHAGNLLLARDGSLYLVDWDNPILAPKERDLMFIGGGVGGIWNSAREDSLFYRGYGPAELNRAALVYYRYERVIEDIAAFADQILLSRGGEEDRRQGYGYFTSSFLPGGVIEIADRTYRKWRQRLLTANR
jgi:spectinomycin phosphotransferase